MRYRGRLRHGPAAEYGAAVGDGLPDRASLAGAIVGAMSEIPLGDESREVAASVDGKAKLDDEAEAEAEAEAQLDAEAEAEAEIEPEAEGEL